MNTPSATPDDELPTVAWTTPGSGSAADASPAPPAAPASGSASSAPRRVPQPGGQLGPFVLESSLGKGGMGAVFRARHAQTGAPYAIKVILRRETESFGDQAIARFRREAEVLSRLSHPGIVRVHATGVEDGDLYTVMELVEGRTLQSRLEQGPLPIDDAVAIAHALADALVYAHGAGVVHRDLKPANVIIDAAGRPRLLDFGLARDALSAERLTKTGTVLGTPEFMAPEQFEPSETTKMGPVTDVYGLGALLYAMLTGEPPLGTHDRITLMVRVMSRYPDAPSSKRAGVPPELEAICLKCLEKEGPARYASAKALAADLTRFRRGEAVEARPLGRLARMWRSKIPARGRGRVAALLRWGATLAAPVVIVVVAAIGWVVVWSADARRQQTKRATGADQELEAMLAAALAGDPDAARRAGSLAAELGRNEAWRDSSQRLLLAGALARIAAGEDEPFLRGLDLGRAPPWTSPANNRGALLLLATLEQSAHLRRQLARRPELLKGDPDLAARIVDAIHAFDRSVPLDPELAAVLTDLLHAASGSETRDASDRRRFEELYYALLARQLDELLTAEPIDEEALLDLIVPLAGRVELTGRAPRLAERAIDRLAELLEAVTNGQREVPRELELLEVALAVIDRDDPVRRVLIESVQELVIAAQFEAEARQKERGWLLGTLLFRAGAWPLSIEALDRLYEDRSALARRMNALLEVEDYNPVSLYSTTATLVRLEAERLEKALPGPEGDRERHAHQRALADAWAAFGKLLARELAEGDLPADAVAWLAESLDDAHSIKASPDEPGLTELLARLDETLPGRHLASDVPGALFALLDELYERARVRNLDRPRMEVIKTCARGIDRERSRPGWEPKDDEALARLTRRYVALLEQAAELSADAEDILRYEVALAKTATLAKGAYQIALDAMVRADIDRPEDDPADCRTRRWLDALAGAVRALTPRSALAWRIEARHLEHHGRFAEAAERMGEGIRREEADERAGQHRRFDNLVDYARLLIRAGDRETARAMLERSNALLEGPNAHDPGDDTLDRRAALWRQVGEDELAERDADAARRLRAARRE